MAATTRTVATSGAQFTSIQAAIDASTDGDIIQVAAGDYTGDVDVNKAVTIQGTQVGKSGTGARAGGESNIIGVVTVSAKNVDLDGLEFTAPTLRGPTVNVTGSETTITNSVLNSDPNNDGTIGVQTNAAGLNFTKNAVNNYSTGIYANPGAAGDASSNTFTNSGSGAVLDSSGLKFHGNALTGSGGADVATDVGGAFATTGANTTDVSSYIYGNTYTNRPTDRAISINPEQDNLTVIGTDANDRLRDDYHHTGITFTGGAGSDFILGNFADLNTDTFSDIQSGESVTVADRPTVTATLTGTQLSIYDGVTTSLVTLGGANGTVAVTSDGKASTITYTATQPAGGGGGGTIPPAPTGGDDYLSGSTGNDSVDLGAGNDSYSGGAGDDTASGGDGNDLILGNEGNDGIALGTGDDVGVGGQGNDVVLGNQGNDQLFGNVGADTLVGGQDNDIAVGGQDADTLLGNLGDDQLFGNKGNDVLNGGMGNDSLYGGQGDDVLTGGKGDDLLFGNAGNNTFQFNVGDTDFASGVSTGDTVGDFKSGTDKVDFAAGPAGTSSNFASGAVTGGNFAALQAAAQQLLTNGATYAFETDGTDGYLFTNAGSTNGSTIDDAVKLAGVKSLQASDIA